MPIARVNGRVDMTPEPSDAALRQLRLRHRLAAAASNDYFGEGFTVVAQDIILGEHLTEMVQMIHQRPLLVVVLAPQAEAVAAREAARAKNAYSRMDGHHARPRPAPRHTPPRALARHLRQDPGRNRR